ncbi:MAG: Kelch repeat-containing protein [Paludibacteraceae bacterium]
MIRLSKRHIATLQALLLAMCCCTRLSTSSVQPHIEQCTDLSVGRTSATSFVINGQLYLFGGRTAAQTATNDFYRYDPDADTWTQLSTPPLKARVKATAAVVNGAAYIGLGFGGKVYNDTAYLHDWWRYDPPTDTWTRLADFTGNGTVGAAAFIGTDGNSIITAYGGAYGLTREVARYDITCDTWTVYDDNWKRAKSAFGIVGAQCDGRYFIGTGFNTDNLDQWYEFSPDDDVWQKRCHVPGKRELSTAVAADKRIYLLGGYYFGGSLTDEKTYDDILAYDTDDDKWLFCGHLPNGSRKNLIACKIGDNIYFGLGEDENDRILSDFYKWINCDATY